MKTDSKLYYEYLGDTLNLMEPDTFKSLSFTSFYSRTSAYIDPYLDYFFYPVNGNDYIGYGFKVTDDKFWDVYNTEKDRTVKMCKDFQGRWYIKIKR